MKNILYILLAIVIIGGGIFVFRSKKAPMIEGIVSNYKDATYQIEGTTIALKDGVSESEAAPGSTAKIVTKYFGNEARGDVNGDGAEDIAFLLTQTNGGTGTFYYAVVALKTDTGYQGTNGVLLGDRIAPQTTEIKDGKIIVNYADRKPDEPMTATPSVGISKNLQVVGVVLSEIK